MKAGRLRTPFLLGVKGGCESCIGEGAGALEVIERRGSIGGGWGPALCEFRLLAAIRDVVESSKSTGEGDP